MHDPRVVDVLQGVQQSVGEGVQRSGGQRSVLPHDPLQREARYVPGRHPRRVVVGPRVEHGRGEPFGDPSGRLDLPPEPGPEPRVGRMLLVHHLHGDGPPAVRPCEEHPPHAAGPEAPQQQVGTDARRIELGERFDTPRDVVLPLATLVPAHDGIPPDSTRMINGTTCPTLEGVEDSGGGDDVRYGWDGSAGTRLNDTGPRR